MKYMITIYDHKGKRTGFHSVEEYDAQEFAGPGTELVSAPFKEGALFYPIDLMCCVLQRYCDDFFDNDIELEEVMTNFNDWKPA
jgi:hypothetical protein